MSTPDPTLPLWWQAAKPTPKTDPDEALFSDANLFAPDEIDVEPEDTLEWDYDAAPSDVRTVLDAMNEAADWLDQQRQPSDT